MTHQTQSQYKNNQHYTKVGYPTNTGRAYNKEHQSEIYNLRKLGHTFSEIGLHYNITRQAAYQAYNLYVKNTGKPKIEVDKH